MEDFSSAAWGSWPLQRAKWNEALSSTECLGHQRTTQNKVRGQKKRKRRKRKYSLKFVPHYNSAVCPKLPSYVTGISVVCFFLLVLTLSDPTLDLVWQYDFPGLLRCRKTSDTVFVAFIRPLSELVRRFSSCSTDFGQPTAQVVLFLFLYDFSFKTVR
jgi:hypothetical protein